MPPFLNPFSPFKSTGMLSILRCFRLLRVFRLARSWTSLNRIIDVLISSMKSVSWLTLLLALFIFITGLLGMTVSLCSR